MFTLEQIAAAHSAVKSGADFPAYVQALIALGVKLYDVFVTDGHTQYFGPDGDMLESGAQYTQCSRLRSRAIRSVSVRV